MFLLIALTGGLLLACSPIEEIGEHSQAACGAPAPQELDLVIRMLGQNGDACTAGTGQTECLSYTDVRPVAISLGDDHAASTSLYLCTNLGGQLNGCVAGQPQGYNCDFGGDCSCGGIVDCFKMVWYGNCVPGTLKCDEDSCTCEYVDGC